MCGILLHLQQQELPPCCANLPKDAEVFEYYEDIQSVHNEATIFDRIVPFICARGPDYSSLRVLNTHKIRWFSSVLSLRQPFTKQSVFTAKRYVLQFNGELYNDDITGNDTEYIASILENITSKDQLVSAIRKWEGEFAFTIYDIQNCILYFGRDQLGRRSLSYCYDQGTAELYVASTTGNSPHFEICDAGKIYIYCTKTNELDTSSQICPSYSITQEIDHDLIELDRYVEKLHNLLYRSVAKRVRSIHPKHLENSPIGVLFSGGLDCSAILSYICKVLIEKTTGPKIIELFNVGFENPRTAIMPEDTPDRRLAIKSAHILQQLYPQIDIRLVEIDVPYEEYLKYRPQVIDLMYPKQTEMDLSIAIAFFFAARGKGKICLDDGTTEQYSRKSIVLFSGLGADELYGGYHKFANKSHEELSVELARQINNIHDRNLIRDDRVIAHNGVEVRYPFLDEHVVRFSTEVIPINHKINKMILRKLAKTHLNLGEISQEPKRAIQFGTKSARMTKNGNKRGTDILQ